MSELKADKTFVFGEECEAYKKSEADKVIAEKDEKIDELEERIDELQKATDSSWSKVNAMYDELRHHKYKRCLEMARWCESNNISLYSVVENNLWKYTSNYWLRWRNKWLELAEKFKEAK